MKGFVWLIALLTLGSGILNLHSALGRPEPNALLLDIFPLALEGFSRTTEMLTGLALVITSVHLLWRRKRAWQVALALAGVSILLHIDQGMNWTEGSLLVALLGLLLRGRSAFTYGSGIPSLHKEGRRIGLAAFTALAYGSAGFWLLEVAEFRHNFHWWEALRQAALFLTFVGDPATQPYTAYAHWFLESLQWISAAVLLYASYALFRPVLYRFQSQPQDLAAARRIIVRHGRNAHDFFKGWPDKSYFFDSSREAFIAYRVANGMAVVLGDPVGPVERLAGTIEQFEAACRENGWRVAFHQATPEMLPAYERLGFLRMKIGDEAIVDLESFTLSGGKRKSLRTALHRLEREGVRAVLYEAPLSAEVLQQAREVSDDWLRQPGNRERGFTLGSFMDIYVANTPLLAAIDANGRMLGFVNIVSSFRTGEATSDLMRRRLDTPNGLMDFLFVKVIEIAKARGYQRFNLGMAPLAGFQPGEEKHILEEALHAIGQRWNVGFRFSGIKEYKAKFATHWEPRYAVFRSRLDVARLGLALSLVSEMPSGGER